ncbi:MAG: hypothetical protein EZS28_041993, partial [Streblomastix strix]
FNFGN